jgi:hypothetical protein
MNACNSNAELNYPPAISTNIICHPPLDTLSSKIVFNYEVI